MRQRTDENIQNFSNRIQQTYHQLTSALTVGKTAPESRVIAETMLTSALVVFMEGINPSIRLILEARNITSYEEAVRIATEKENVCEKSYNTKNYKPFNKGNSNKSHIKCNRCSKLGHYANECRSSAPSSSGFRNPINNRTEIKVERTENIKFCKYCKKPNHDISECRKRIFNENKKKQEQVGNQSKTVGELKNIRVITTQMEEEHITINANTFSTGNLKFLIDSGAEMNIIKLSALKDQVVVNGSDKKNIKGISSAIINTLGSIVIPIEINNATFITKFDIVKDVFPIPGSGIIGRTFLKENKAILDMNKEILLLPEREWEQPLIIPPRSNCVMLIKNIENIECKEITIAKQDLNDDVIIANSISPVNKKVLISNVINISEKPYLIEELTSRNIDWEPYHENIRLIETKISGNKIKQLATLINTEHLNNEEKNNLFEIINDYSDLFYVEGEPLTSTDIVTHKINTPRCVKPINIRPYRLPWAYQQEIEKQVAEMKQDNIIRNSTSPFNFPLVVVKKKETDQDGKQKLRICVDFRKLNEMTENEAYSLPNLLEILESLGSSKYFSTLDLKSGYHQIKIDESDIHKTAFSTKTGHYEYVRMPFGLSSAPATFTRAMKAVLMGLEEMCTAYLDDIVVHGSSLRDHQEKLMRVFDRLRTHNLKLQPQKCNFLRKEVVYLGHVINETGVSPDPRKIQCIKDYPRPKNAKDIKSFLGLLNYYRRFVVNFAKIAKPLTSLLKKNIIFNWTDKCENAFCELKNILMSPPLLIYPDWEKGNFNLTTDASQFAIGAVLSQGTIPTDQPIAYASRTLNKAEINYSVIQKELLAIIWAVKYFRPYLYGRKFNIITDHRPLTFLFGLKDVSSQLMRWRLQLSEYDYTIIYRAGSENANADCLSRIHVLRTDDLPNVEYDDFLIAETTPIFNSKVIELEGSIKDADERTNLFLPVSNDAIITHPAIRKIIEKFNIELPTFNENENITITRHLTRIIIFYKLKETHTVVLTEQQIFNAFNKMKQTCIENNIETCATIRLEGVTTMTSFERTRSMIRFIFKGTDITVNIYKEQSFTDSEKQRIIYEYHNSPLGGHSGVSRTVKRLKLNYQWKNLKKSVKQYISSCEVCQKTKTHLKTKQPMLITSTVTNSFERICLDIVGPLPQTSLGNQYILTMQDELTRYAIAVALSATDAQTVAQAFVECFVCIYGIPDSILTDCGTNFLSDVFKQMCKLLDIEKSKSTPWHPQTNGFLERSHRTLKNYLRSFVDRDNEWDNFLCYATFCYNSTIHTSTNYTPYELVFGHKPNIPAALSRKVEPQYNYDNYVFDFKRNMQQAHEIARNNLINKKQDNKRYYDQTINPLTLHVGDKVLVKEQHKKNTLSLNWSGPYEVIMVHDNENVTIKKGRRDYRIHVNNIKKFFHE